jgi:hypothetical protein
MTLGYSFQVAGYGLRVAGYEFQVSNLRLVSIFVLKPSKHYATFSAPAFFICIHHFNGCSTIAVEDYFTTHWGHAIYDTACEKSPHHFPACNH